MKLYVLYRGQVTGPFEEQQIVAWRKTNILTGDSLVKTEQSADWVKLDSIIENLPATVDWWWNDATALLEKRGTHSTGDTGVVPKTAARTNIPCSHCGSSSVDYPDLTRQFITPKLVGILCALRIIPKQFYCRDCHFTWTNEKEHGLWKMTTAQLTLAAIGLPVAIFLVSWSYWLSVTLLCLFALIAFLGGLWVNAILGTVVSLVIVFIGMSYINVRFPEQAERQEEVNRANQKAERLRAWGAALARRDHAMGKMYEANAYNKGDEAKDWLNEATKAQQAMHDNQQAMHENQQWDDSTAAPSVTVTPPKAATGAPKVKVNLEVSDMGIDSQGYLQVLVQNHTPVSLNLVNISWFFYDKDGRQIMDGSYPKSVITSKARDGSHSTLIAPEESKTYCNPLTPVQRIFGWNLANVAEAEIKIYIPRADFDDLHLDSDIESNETTIREVFQSNRFPLR
jgi:hypothetical protein